MALPRTIYYSTDSGTYSVFLRLPNRNPHDGREPDGFLGISRSKRRTMAYLADSSCIPSNVVRDQDIDHALFRWFTLAFVLARMASKPGTRMTSKKQHLASWSLSALRNKNREKLLLKLQGLHLSSRISYGPSLIACSNILHHVLSQTRCIDCTGSHLRISDQRYAMADEPEAHHEPHSRGLLGPEG